jgi:hypothetical protein
MAVFLTRHGPCTMRAPVNNLAFPEVGFQVVFFGVRFRSTPRVGAANGIPDGKCHSASSGSTVTWQPGSDTGREVGPS